MTLILTTNFHYMQWNTGDYLFDPLKSKPVIAWEDVRNAYLAFRDQNFKYYNEMYKNYYMWTKDRETELLKTKQEWKTNIRAPITHMFVNGMFNLLLQADLNFTAIDRIGKYSKNEDKPVDSIEPGNPTPGPSQGNVRNMSLPEEITIWVDYIMSSEDTMDTFYSACFDSCLLGRWHYKTWYKYTSKDYTYLAKDGKTKTVKDVDDYPFIRYVSPFNLFTVGWYNNLNTRFHVERRIIPIQKLEDEYKLLKLKLKKEEIAQGSHVDFVDHDAIKTNMALYNVAEGNNIYTDNTYNIGDKFAEVFELTSDTNISIWINQVYHGTFPKIGPYKKMDYHTLSFKKNPGSKYGPWIGYIVKPIQYAFDALLNMRIDNVKLAMNKMFFVDPSINFFENEWYLPASPGKVIKVKDPSAVKEISISDVNNSGYMEVDSLFGLTQGLVGMSSPMLGMQGKVERTATGSEMIKEASDNQLRYVLKSISRNMGETLKEMLILSLVYADQETFDKVLGEWNILSTIDVQDVVDDFIFSLEATGPKSQNMTLKNQQMMQLMGMVEDPTQKEKLFEELMRSMNLNPDDFKWDMPPMAPEQWMPWGWGVPWVPPVSTQWVPSPEVENPMQWSMGDLQQIPWAGVPPEMMTNPIWKNTT